MVFNIAGDAPCKAMQGIANDRPEIAQRSPRGYLIIVRSQSGRQDSNLRPSAPKALDQQNATVL